MTPGDPPERFQIADHELITLIERGSYGEIWMARNAMGTFRAVKVIRRAAFKESSPYESELKGIRTFEPISRSHPGFVDILQIGQSTQQELFYYVMEIGDDLEHGHQIDEKNYVPKTLDRVRLQDRQLSAEKCLRLGAQLSDALSRLHEAGLVHRDIKPANIIFFQGYPKLADIGLVTNLDDAKTLVGTLGYIPPEGPGSARADVYALGKVLYECLTGLDRTQFPDLPQFAMQLEDPQKFRELMEVINRAAHPDPAQRYATARELHADLALLENGRSIIRLRNLERKWTRAKRLVQIGAAVLLLAAPLGGWLRERNKLEGHKRQQEILGQMITGFQSWDTLNFAEASGVFASLLSSPGAADQKGPNRSRYLGSLDRLPKLTSYASVTGQIMAGALSPDGKLVALGVGDGRVLLSQTDALNLHPTLTNHAGAVIAVEFAPQGGQLASLGYEKVINLWDLEGRLLKRFILPKRLTAMCYLPDGSGLITGAADGEVTVWNVEGETLRPLNAWQEQGGAVLTLAAREDCIASGSSGGDLVMRKPDGSNPIVRGHPKRISHVSFSPDGHRIVVGCENHKAYIYATSNGLPVLAPLKHQREVMAVQFSPDGRLLLTGGFDSQLRIWNADDGDPKVAVIPHGNQIAAARFFPDGHRILTACYHGSIRIWDLAGVNTPRKIPRAYQFLTSDRWLDQTAQPAALIGPDGSQRIPLGTSNEIRSWVGTPDSRFLISLMTPTKDRWSVEIWDAKQGTPLASPIRGEGRNPMIFPGLKSFSVSTSNIVHSFSVPDGKPIHAPLTLSAVVTSVTPPDQPRLAVCHGRQVTLFDLPTGLRQVLDHDMSAHGASFAPSGNKVVTWTHTPIFDACYGQVWDVANGQPAGPRLQHLDGIHRIVWSRRGDKLVSASEDGTGFIWDVGTGARMGTALHHDNQIVDVDLVGQGEQILTASTDRTVRTWDLATGLPIDPGMPLTWDLDRANWRGGEIVITERGGDQWLWQKTSTNPDPEHCVQLSRFLSAETHLIKTRPQDPDPLLDLWNQLKTNDPERFRVSTEELLRWHSYQADLASTARQYRTELFHLDRVLELSPNRLGVQAQRTRALSQVRKLAGR